jgi:virulence factor Mce-like protein
MTRRSSASLVASPVLLGAVTTLVLIVAVFLSYNANTGLPFVPTYDIWAQLPSGANLVKGNEVRLGGFRVGVVDELVPAYDPARHRTIAKVHLKLDKTVEPLAKDTTLIVRQRSALGLKYVQLNPGHAASGFRPGDTIPLRQAGHPVEFDDFFDTFDEKTRDASRVSVKGFGDALAARGTSLNGAIAALNPFLVHLTPVMRNLASPETHLDDFFREIGRASAEVAPVASVQARLFTNMADTFAAIDHSPANLQQSIEEAPSTLDTATASFKTQQPFFADFADLSHRLRPTAGELPRMLPALNSALKSGTNVLPDTVDLNDHARELFSALDDLARNPNMLLALKDLTTTVAITGPLLEYISPFQSVCNNAVYWFSGLSGHLSEDVNGGTVERVLVRDDHTLIQPGRLGDSANWRPADVPSNVSAKTTKGGGGDYLEAYHNQPYQPAIDPQGNADCQAGQSGYLNGPLPRDGRYPPTAEQSFVADNPVDPFYRDAAGGSHVVVQPNTPGLAGPTYTGVPNLRDVP